MGTKGSNKTSIWLSCVLASTMLPLVAVAEEDSYCALDTDETCYGKQPSDEGIWVRTGESLSVFCESTVRTAAHGTNWADLSTGEEGTTLSICEGDWYPDLGSDWEKLGYGFGDASFCPRTGEKLIAIRRTRDGLCGGSPLCANKDWWFDADRDGIGCPEDGKVIKAGCFKPAQNYVPATKKKDCLRKITGTPTYDGPVKVDP